MSAFPNQLGYGANFIAYLLYEQHIYSVYMSVLIDWVNTAVVYTVYIINKNEKPRN